VSLAGRFDAGWQVGCWLAGWLVGSVQAGWQVRVFGRKIRRRGPSIPCQPQTLDLLGGLLNWLLVCRSWMCKPSSFVQAWMGVTQELGSDCQAQHVTLVALEAQLPRGQGHESQVALRALKDQGESHRSLRSHAKTHGYIGVLMERPLRTSMVNSIQIVHPTF
jgi:hypothetical protein